MRSRAASTMRRPGGRGYGRPAYPAEPSDGRVPVLRVELGSGRGADREQRDVVVEGLGREAFHGLPHGTHDLHGGAPGGAGRHRQQPLRPELLAAAAALGDAVGVDEQGVARGPRGAGCSSRGRWAPARPRCRTCRSAPRCRPPARAPAARARRARAPRRGPAGAPCPPPAPRRWCRLTIAAASVQNCSGSPASIMTSLSRSMARGQGAAVAHEHPQHVADQPGAGGGPRALPADVADRHQPVRRVDGEHVVEVAADVAAACWPAGTRPRSRGRAPPAARGAAAPAAEPGRRPRARAVLCALWMASAARRAMSPASTTSSGLCGPPVGAGRPAACRSCGRGSAAAPRSRRWARRTAPADEPSRTSSASRVRSSAGRPGRALRVEHGPQLRQGSSSSAWVRAARRSPPDGFDEVHRAPAAQPWHDDLGHHRDRQVDVEGLAEQLAGLGEVGHPGPSALVHGAQPLRLHGHGHAVGDQLGEVAGALRRRRWTCHRRGA